MAISLVQHVSNTVTSGASLTITVTSTGAGNTLVAAITLSNASGGSNTATVSSVTLGGVADNFASAAVANSGSDPNVDIWTDINCAGGKTSVVVTPSATTGIMVDVYEFTGVSSVDKTHTGTATSTSWSSGSTATTTNDIEAWVGVVGAHSGGSNTITGPSAPWTNETQLQIGSTFASHQMSGYQVTSSKAAATYSGTQTASATYGSVVVTLNPVITSVSVTTMTETFNRTNASQVNDTVSTATETLSQTITTSTNDSVSTMTESLSTSVSAFSATVFPSNILGLKIEILINGTWTDISQYVYQRNHLAVTSGRPDESSTLNPAQITLTLNNRDGRFTVSNSSGAYYPYLTKNTQVRVSVTASSTTGVVYQGYRFWGELSALPPRWDVTGSDVYVSVTASGLMRRIRQSKSAGSALHRYYSSLSGTSNAPAAWWACEDNSAATSFASGVSGGSTMTWTGTPSLASDTSCAGADALPQLKGSVWTGSVGSFSAAGADTYSTPGTYTWTCPGNITSLTSAEAWGAGGGGGWGSAASSSGSSGGGGEYAKEATVAVTPGTGYPVVVGAGGTGSSGTGSGTSGTSSSFTGDAVTVTAHGGVGGHDNGGSVGTGGTGSTNTTHHDGGAGALGAVANAGGAGGGSSAGTSLAGVAGSAPSGDTGGAGGSAPTGGGSGGSGGTYTACVDHLTDILTDRGWLTMDQVTTRDRTLALNVDTGAVEWSQITAVTVHEGPWKMVLITGPEISACVTSDHRWLVQTTTGLVYRTTTDLRDDDVIPLSHADVMVKDCSRQEVITDARVWCPTTEHGNWLARRHDTTYFIGNKP